MTSTSTGPQSVESPNRSRPVLAIVLASIAASWGLCSWSLGLPGSVAAWICGGALAAAGVALFLLTIQRVASAGLRRVARASGLVATLIAAFSLALKAAWLPEHPYWGGFFLSCLPVAVGGVVWLGWKRRLWLVLPPSADVTPVAADTEEPRPEVARSEEERPEDAGLDSPHPDTALDPHPEDGEREAHPDSRRLAQSA